MKYKELSSRHKTAIINQIKLMLAAHRNYVWNRWSNYDDANPIDPVIHSVICNEGYYGEAFGIMRGLREVGYGYFGTTDKSAVEEDKSYTPEHNLRWWFHTLQREYLVEEGFFNYTCSAKKCSELLDKYRSLVSD
jgi:hypothetical protein